MTPRRPLFPALTRDEALADGRAVMREWTSALLAFAPPVFIVAQGLPP
jgi:hypothetical protein